jgi:hypothetical protein
MPVWPTWNLCGYQPASVTAREAPTAAPRESASFSISSKSSAEPTPRPPETTIAASASSGRSPRSEPTSLRAELMAAAVVAAHNHVLRRWLRAECPDPVAEIDEAMRQVIELFAGPAARHDAAGTGSGATIVAFRTSQDIDALLPALRRLIQGPTE